MPSKREGVESDDEADKAPPLTVEEAKSGRSTCKSSGEKIEQGEMRVGMEAYMGGRMTMAWQKLTGFFDNCRLENCVRKASGRCRATGYTFQQGDVRFVATMGSDRPHKMFLTIEASQEAMAPAVAAQKGTKWDPTSLQGLCNIKEAPRKEYYSLFGVAAKKAAAFDKKYPPPAEDADVAGPARKRKAPQKSYVAAAGNASKPSKRRKQQAADSGADPSQGDSEAEEAEEEGTAAELAAQEDVSGDEQDSDSEQEATPPTKPAQSRARRKAQSPPNPVNDYEQQRLDNIARNQARMKELNLMGAVAAITPASKPKPTATKGLQPRKRQKEPPGPRRASLRQQGIASNGSKIEHERRNGEVVVVNGERIRYGAGADEGAAPEPVERHPKGDVAFKGSRGGSDADERFVRLLAMQTASGPPASQRSGAKPVSCSKMANFTLAESNVAKVIQGGVTHVAWHPRSDTPVLAAGDKAGHLSLWQLDHESFRVPPAAVVKLEGAAKPAGSVRSGGGGASLRGAEAATTARESSNAAGSAEEEEETNEDRVDDGIVTNLRPHHAYISGLRWVGGRGGAAQLLTVSYDGSLRRLDPGAGAAFSLLRSDKIAEYSAMDATSDGTSIWLGDNDGTVEAIDTRAPEPAQEVPICTRKINTLSLEPSEERMLAVAGGDGSLTLWDVRKLDPKGEAIASVRHSKICQSAFFAPDGSHRVLSTSRDDTLRIWRGRDNMSEATSIAHNNNTGRYITPFRAVWGPSSDSVICGNMKRMVNVYDDEGSEVALLSSDLLTAIPSRFAIHNHLPLLAATTASGRIHVFR